MEQIIDISQDGRHLAKMRGFLTVSETDQEVGRVPFDQITAVIVHAHGITWSNSLIIELAERGIPVVFCASNHAPKSVLWPLEGNHIQGARMRAQWGAAKPLLKQAWKQVVIAKIAMQGAALASIGAPYAVLEQLSRKVKTGDTSNTEAQAARYYWPLLMGREFRRNTSGEGVNALLNYGYTVLRATTARAISAAGLHPTIGLFHSNRGNAFALADDLMEPFRPLVDLTVLGITRHGATDVSPEAKQKLARLINFDLPLPGGLSPTSIALSRLATSLAQSFESGRLSLALPRPPSPLALNELSR